MKWVEKHNKYWELVSKNGAVLAVVHRGRKTFFCSIEATGKHTDFSGYGLFSTVDGAFKKAKKWCEDNLNE